MSRGARIVREAGFSLLEALVTLFIVAMLSTAGVSILSMTLDGRSRFDAGAARTADLERAHAALRTDLAQLVRRTTRDAAGGRRAYVFAGGHDVLGGAADAPLLAFTRTGRDNPDGLEARGSTAYVEYAVVDGALVRRMAVRTDPTDRTPVVETVLLRGVERADVAFGSGETWGDAYVLGADTTGGATFPDVVELTLALDGVGEVRQRFMTGVAP